MRCHIESTETIDRHTVDVEFARTSRNLKGVHVVLSDIINDRWRDAVIHHNIADGASNCHSGSRREYRFGVESDVHPLSRRIIDPRDAQCVRTRCEPIEGHYRDGVGIVFVHHSICGGVLGEVRIFCATDGHFGRIEERAVGVCEVHTDGGITRHFYHEIADFILMRIHDTRVLDDIRGVQREADHLQYVTQLGQVERSWWVIHGESTERLCGAVHVRGIRAIRVHQKLLHLGDENLFSFGLRG